MRTKFLIQGFKNCETVELKHGVITQLVEEYDTGLDITKEVNGKSVENRGKPTITWGEIKP